MTGPVMLNMSGCARCHGEGHTAVLFLPLAHPVTLPGGDLTHWAPCPENGEPILARMNSETAPEPYGYATEAAVQPVPEEA